MRRTQIFFIFLVGVLLVGYALNGSAQPEAPRQFRHQFTAMGTGATLIVELPAPREADFQRLAAAVETTVKEAEALMSRFNPDSDVSRFNAAPAGEMIAVNPLTWQVLMQAQRVYELSVHAFDITVLPLIKLYDWKNAETMAFPDTAALTAARAKIGMDKIIWQREGMKIGKTIDGVEIDLGGVAKGFGVDLAGAVLRQHGIRNAIIDIGGEQKIFGKPSAPTVTQKIGADSDRANGADLNGANLNGAARNPVATAENPDTADGAGWTTGIRAPRGNGLDLAQVLRVRRDCALATSGDYEKFFLRDGKRYSHILDPRVGLPLSGGVISATIITPDDCALADALATAASVLGADGAAPMLAAFPQVEAWLVLEDNSVRHFPAADYSPRVERE